MKITISVLLFFSIFNFVKGQWSNSGNNYTTGKLGIGTTSLNIGNTSVNDLVVGDASWSEGLIINANSNNDGIMAFASDGNMVARFIYNNPTGKLKYSKTGIGDLFAIDGNGNIGIGSTDPTANLEVYNWGSLAHTRIYTNQHAGMARLEIAGGVAGFGTGYSGWNIYHSHNQTNKDLYFRHGQTGGPNVIFADNGNVAIHGKLESKEVKVTLTPTADFVFEDDYNLPTLEFIENHIKHKKHLPEIASAKEMEENGVNIGEFQIQLLQKIEELTLYTIQQEKKIKKLESLNKKLIGIQKKLEKLEKK